jgi:hypothetical protein
VNRQSETLQVFANQGCIFMSIFFGDVMGFGWEIFSLYIAVQDRDFLRQFFQILILPILIDHPVSFPGKKFVSILI